MEQMEQQEYDQQMLSNLRAQADERDFALLANSSNDLFVMQDGVDYTHSVGLFRHGLPEILVHGSYPLDLCGELIKSLMVMWTTAEPKDRTFDGTDVVLEGFREGKRFVVRARTAIMSEQNRLRYGKIIGELYPEEEFRMVQLMMPDEAGLLPNDPNYIPEEFFPQAYLGAVENAPEMEDRKSVV